jgi:hypothetical protein
MCKAKRVFKCCGYQQWIETNCDCDMPEHLTVNIDECGVNLKDCQNMCPECHSVPAKHKRAQGFQFRRERELEHRMGTARNLNVAISNVQALVGMGERGFTGLVPPSPHRASQQAAPTSSVTGERPHIWRRPLSTTWFTSFTDGAMNEHNVPLPSDWEFQVRSGQVADRHIAMDSVPSADLGIRLGLNGPADPPRPEVRPVEQLPAFAPLGRPSARRPHIRDLFEHGEIPDLQPPRQSDAAWDSVGSAAALQRLRTHQTAQGHPPRSAADRAELPLSSLPLPSTSLETFRPPPGLSRTVLGPSRHRPKPFRPPLGPSRPAIGFGRPSTPPQQTGRFQQTNRGPSGQTYQIHTSSRPPSKLDNQLQGRDRVSARPVVPTFGREVQLPRGPGPQLQPRGML